MANARFRYLAPIVVLASTLLITPLAAQSSTSGTNGSPPAQPATAPAAPPAAQPAAQPGLSFSSVLFGSFNYTVPTSPNPFPNQRNNLFVIDRAYLTFRMPAGEHASIRITTDVFQSTDSSSNAYTVRAKYAYLQYEWPKLKNGVAITARGGIIQNVLIDYLENFWPRYLSQAATERAGYFASADVGVASLVTLPNKMGEVYMNMVNGPGYTLRERDRFKDYGLRVSLTPLANNTSSSLFQTLSLTAWGYLGATASAFVNGGPLQAGPVGDANDRSRAGIFLGIRDPRLQAGFEFAQRHDGGDAGLNTVLVPRVATTTTGRMLSGFAVARPWAFIHESGKSPFGVVLRYDHITPSEESSGFVLPPQPENTYHNLIAGVFWDIAAKAQVALDYQEQLSSSNGFSANPPAPIKGYFVHFQATF